VSGLIRCKVPKLITGIDDALPVESECSL
jgi:hypothetical protein